MPLTLPEQIFLLSRDDASGHRQGTYVQYAIAGAALAELLLKGRVSIEDTRKKRLSILSTTPTGDAFIDACLDRLVTKGADRPARAYIQILARKRMLDLLKDHMIGNDLITEIPKPFLVFRWREYAPKDLAVKQALKTRLADILFREAEPTAEDCVLIALADKTHLLRRNFDKAELKTAKSRIKAIADGSLIPAKATIELIRAIQTAVLVSTVIPALTAASSN